MPQSRVPPRRADRQARPRRSPSRCASCATLLRAARLRGARREGDRGAASAERLGRGDFAAIGAPPTSRSCSAATAACSSAARNLARHRVPLVGINQGRARLHDRHRALATCSSLGGRDPRRPVHASRSARCSRPRSCAAGEACCAPSALNEVVVNKGSQAAADRVPGAHRRRVRLRSARRRRHRRHADRLHRLRALVAGPDPAAQRAGVRAGAALPAHALGAPDERERPQRDRDHAACARVDARVHFDGFALTDMARGRPPGAQALGRTPSASCIRPATATSPCCARSCTGARRRSKAPTGLAHAARRSASAISSSSSASNSSSAAGFTVLTGETGAGKSILVDALELLVGGRGDAALVRDGAERAELSAEFDVAGGCAAGRLAGRARAGGRSRQPDPAPHASTARDARAASSTAMPATLAQLREAGECLVDIHGQHAHQSLLRPAAQRELLDAHAGAQALARDCAAAFRDWQRLRGARRRGRAAVRAARGRARRAAGAGRRARTSSRLQRGRMGAAGRRAPAPGARLEPARGRAVLARDAVRGRGRLPAAALGGGQRGCARSRRTMRGCAAIVELLESAEAQAGEAARDAARTTPRASSSIPRRCARPRRASRRCMPPARKFRVRAGGAAGACRRSCARGSRSCELAADPEALQREVAAAKDALRRRGEEALAPSARARRRRSSQGGDRRRCSSLAMSGGRFAVALHALEAPGAAGTEEVEFEVASHPEPAAAAARQGGLRRRAFAHQPRDPAGGGKASPVATLVFDEVDAGIGGAVAEIVGRSLQPARQGAPGAVRDAPAAGRGAGRRAVVGGAIRRRAARSHAAPRARPRRRASRSWRACSAARRSPRPRASTPRSC